MNKVKKSVNIETIARDNIISQVGQELMDLDLISNKMMGKIPNTSSEMKYRIALRWDTRVHIFLCVLGFLMFMSIIITII